MEKALDWIFDDSWRVFLVQIILWTGGVLAVVSGLILLVRSRLRHEVLPREFVVESDCRALRIIALVIFGLEILLLSYGPAGIHSYDWSQLFAACGGWLVLFGLVIAVRSRRWGYVLLLTVELCLFTALFPACCAAL